MHIYKINGYPDYELHYSNEVQLVYNRKFKRYLKFYKNRGGYLQVCLSKNGKVRTFYIHQLVWLCLKGDIPQGLEINHIDEVKTNNRIENLELVTPKQNINHGTHNERAAKARINHPMRSKAIVGIKKNLSEILQYPSTMEAERDKEKGFNHGNICQCCLNRKKHITHKNYYWFFKEDFDSYLTRFNNNLEEVIKYKLSLS